MRNRKGQTILEYTIIVIIILGVMIAMKDYVKRGIQGRWKTSSDDFADQYDPQYVNALTNYSTQSNSQSIVTVVNATYFDGTEQQTGQRTNRIDMSNTLDTKTGYSQIGQ